MYCDICWYQSFSYIALEIEQQFKIEWNYYHSQSHEPKMIFSFDIRIPCANQIYLSPTIRSPYVYVTKSFCHQK